MTSTYRVEWVDIAPNTYGVVLANLIPVDGPQGEDHAPRDLQLRTYDPAVVELLKVGAVVTLSIEETK